MDITVLKRSLSTSLSVVLLYSCQHVLYVAPRKMDCTGSSAQKCYLVKKDLDENWVLQYDPIIGLDYIEGFQYKIKAKRERIKNPAADGSAYQLRVTEIMEKKQVYDQPDLLGGKVWQLQSYGKQGEEQQPLEDSQITAEFNMEEQKVNGRSGCNRYFGTYKADVSKISFGPLGSTRMACEEALMDQEMVFLDILQSAGSYAIEERTLKVVGSDDRVLTFTHE
jgi:heat shock protein HslJ